MYHPKSCIKPLPCTLARKFCILVTYKTFRQVLPEGLCVTLNRRRYPATLINNNEYLNQQKKYYWKNYEPKKKNNKKPKKHSDKHMSLHTS